MKGRLQLGDRVVFRSTGSRGVVVQDCGVYVTVRWRRRCLNAKESISLSAYPRDGMLRLATIHR